MYRITLTLEQQQEVNRRAHSTFVLPCTRDRLEMVRLSHAGWSVPRIALHLGQHDQTVRTWIKAFLAGGFEALSDKPHGGVHAGHRSALTPEILSALKTELSKGERTWTTAQIAEWLLDSHGVRLSLGRLRLHLRRAGLRYKRTSQSLRHRQDAQAVAQARISLEMLVKGGKPA